MSEEECLERISDEILFGTDNTVLDKRSVMNGLRMAFGIGFDEGRKSIKGAYFRKIVQLNLVGQPIKLWPSILGAATSLGINSSGITKAASGKRKTCGGFLWKYTDV